MAEKKKSRVVSAVKSAPDTPASFAPVPQTNTSNGAFDPAEVVKRENVWWLNGSKRYFRPTPNPNEWICVGEQDIKRKLRLAGVFSRAGVGQSFSQVDRVMEIGRASCRERV